MTRTKLSLYAGCMAVREMDLGIGRQEVVRQARENYNHGVYVDARSLTPAELMEVVPPRPPTLVESAIRPFISALNHLIK